MSLTYFELEDMCNPKARKRRESVAEVFERVGKDRYQRYLEYIGHEPRAELTTEDQRWIVEHFNPDCIARPLNPNVQFMWTLRHVKDSEARFWLANRLDMHNPVSVAEAVLLAKIYRVDSDLAETIISV